MSKILKNTTTSSINLDIGLLVPASGQITLQPTDFVEAADSDQLVELIGDGSIKVNDGNEDLTKAQGMALILSGFRKTDFDEDLLESNRLKIDVMGTLGDGQVKVTSADTSAAFLNTKIVVGSNKLSKNVNNAGSAEELQLDVNTANIGTSELNNDQGFITSGQAPVQPSDIANFETSAQLNVRDASNRNRANHTGTQVASTISDFTTAVQAAETTTALTIAANILTYTDENGSQTNIDLNPYLDDTNLARLVSGSLDSNTGIVTFTRDDNTTFTINMSSLLDNQVAADVPFTPSGNTTSTDVQAAIQELQTEIDLNTPKVSADGSIDTHNDVDITTTSPSPGDLLSWDGSNFVPTNVSNGFTIFPIWAEENGGLVDNNRQWSFGNGSTGSDNIVIPIDCEIFAFSASAETASGTCSFNILVNDSISFTSNQLANNSFQSLATPLQITAGQRIGYRTDDEVGAWTDVRICAWFRVASSSAGNVALNDLTDVSTSSPVAGQAIVFNGSNYTNVDVIEPSELAAVATTGAYSDLTGLPILGTAADNAETDFATAAQGALADTAIQPASISNFETTAQLNTRDTNNRNRSNHTGTQLASTISDFAAQVQADETTTSLSFTSATNTLSYIDEDGTITNINLSQYVDDTNLARIVSGTINPTNNIATFTRDDSSTFTIDFSSLNDQTAITTAINTHEISITNHDDVDTSGAVAGDLLEYNGSAWVPSKKLFRDFITKTTAEGTQGTAFEQYLSLSTTVPEAGNYRISWNYEWSLNTTGSDFRAQIQVDNSNTILNHREEPQDSAGTGITVTNLTGGTFNSGTDQRRGEAGFEIISLTAGNHTIDLDLANSVAGTDATIYRACITIERF